MRRISLDKQKIFVEAITQYLKDTSSSFVKAEDTGGYWDKYTIDTVAGPLKVLAPEVDKGTCAVAVFARFEPVPKGEQAAHLDNYPIPFNEFSGKFNYMSGLVSISPLEAAEQYITMIDKLKEKK